MLFPGTPNIFVPGDSVFMLFECMCNNMSIYIYIYIYILHQMELAWLFFVTHASIDFLSSKHKILFLLFSFKFITFNSLEIIHKTTNNPALTFSLVMKILLEKFL